MGTNPAGWGYITGLAPAAINYNYADTGSLRITTSSGYGDVFNVLEDGAYTTLNGNNEAIVNVGDSTTGVQSIVATLNIENQSSGTDISINDSANTRVTTSYMGTNPAGWGYITGLAPAAINYKYADTNSLTINTSSAYGDGFNVLEDGVPTTLVGNNVVGLNVGDGSVGVQSIFGALTIENPPSGTDISINDSANKGVTTSTMGTNPAGWGYITGLAPAAINYRYADTGSLEITTSSGHGDVFNVLEDGAYTTLIGNNEAAVNVGDATTGVQSIVATLIIENQSSGTDLSINDSANKGVTTSTMGTSPAGWGYITGLAPAAIDYKYADTNSLTIDTSSAYGDVFGVWKTASTPL